MTSRTLAPPALALATGLGLGFAGATACGGDAEPTDDGRVYYANPCGRGDPVARMCPSGETTLELDDAAVPRCSDRAISEGDSCTAEGERCVQLPAEACSSDPTRSINSAAYLTCRSEPFPTNQGCPMSTEAVKKDILHIDDRVRAEIAETMLTTKLARYAYVSKAVGDPAPQLGFLIEELGEAPYVLHSDGAHVNVYGYASAILATVQEQAQQIERLAATVERLERQVSTLREERQEEGARGRER